MKVRSLLILTACAVLTPLVTAGQLAGDDEIPTVKMVVYPAAEPRPALKYQLLPPLIDRRPGNAAVFYNRIPAERTALFASGAMWQKLGEWDDAPVSELREEEARNTIEGLWHVVEDLHRAARSEYCDWQLLIREKEFITLPLREFQQTRAYARILAPWVRLKIADGKYEEAAHGLQTGFALGRDLTKAPCLVCGLIGCAIAGMMNQQIHEFIQQPDAPNLYWALSRLPQPLIDLRPCFEGEMYIIPLSYPDLHDLDNKDYTPDRWQKLLQQTTESLYSWMSGPRAPEDEQLLGITWFLHGYPRAKRLLVESGRSPEEVEAMPVPQVILMGAMKNHDELRDDMFKWLAFPYPQSRKGTEAAELNLVRVSRSGDEVLPIASTLLPAVQSAKVAEVRIDREIALLQTIEALRLYVADHRILPHTLNDVTQVPVPIDPVREEPFVYRRSGRTAVLEVIGMPGPGRHFHGVRYEIQFARKGN